MDRAIKHAGIRLYDRAEIERIRRQLHQLELQYRVGESADRVALRKRRIAS